MPSITNLLLAVGVFVLQVISAPVTPNNACGASSVHVRVPEGMSTVNTGVEWMLPPVDFYFKPWFMTYSSLSANLALSNMQYDPTPFEGSEDGAINDLSSFQLPGQPTIYTTYGVDKPAYPNRVDILNYVGTGIISTANSTLTWLAWGCDANGEAYYANYATPTSQTTAEIDILSVNVNGPDQATVEAIRKQLVKIGNEEIQDQVNKMRKMMHDDGRKGMPRITECDDQCKTNENLAPILGGGA